MKIFIFLGTLFFLFVVYYLIRKKKKKQKDWFLFEKVEGYENNPKKSYFAVHKKTGIRRSVYPNAK